PVFDLCGGNSDGRSGILLAAGQGSARYVVSPTPPALGRMARAHPVSATVVSLASLSARDGGGVKRRVFERQRFAVVVELTHQAEVQLYARLRAASMKRRR